MAGSEVAASGRSAQPTVAEYAVRRLAALGIEHVFGVPGDYAFAFDAAIEASTQVSWVRDSNELNAAYAADGYARIRGAAILCTTYAVGELSALNGVMGSYAERLPVFHLVGQPSSRLQRARAVTHHSLGDGMFRQFENLSAATACVVANLTPQNAIAELERVIFEALTQRRPAYITMAQEYGPLPVIGTPVSGTPLAQVPRTPSDPASLDAAVAAIAQRVAAAESTVVLPAYTIGRFDLRRQLTRFLDATGLGYATTPMDKAVISDTNPHFLGTYAGTNSNTGVQDAVEGAGLVLNLGGVAFADFNTGAWTDGIDPDRMITVWPDYVQAGNVIFGAVYLADVLERLTTTLPKAATPKPPAPKPATPQPPAALPGAASERVSSATLYPRLARFFREDDIVIAETGLCMNYLAPIPLPEGAVFHNQTLWGSIGWATPAAFGATMADPSRRTVLITGDGSHQLTAGELGAMGHYGAKPVIILLNNGMYGIEEVLSPAQGHVYDVLVPWNYHDLPAALGCTGWYTARVGTVGELDAALATASRHDNGCYLEIMLGRSDIPASVPEAVLDRLYQFAPTNPALPAIASAAAAEAVNGGGRPS
ncbi:alpha-keto acid decarboxylase family protein [Streptacidiphilus sp. P02-A3a]|uniref:alpha-keto acid decarboxylase family protein n=1 Tax=Streptacidiphilus sp. P02-A3a TaxID=2704468 RepID=UPI0015FC2C4B|nr:thiamine pyrophosphate-binding protein [Streptacidiphilus sp. P02-A3a]QMU69663.1 alpha-keto acid decarboxylase family protein [Streptacidiphilus sp. P02-A3a]